MTYPTLEQAWKAFAADTLDPFDPLPQQYIAMEMAFMMGAAALYMAISEARKSDAPMERMQHLFDEMDFYMKMVAKRSPSVDSPGHA